MHLEGLGLVHFVNMYNGSISDLCFIERPYITLYSVFDNYFIPGIFGHMTSNNVCVWKIPLGLMI